jgi:broad specificity phosphatase PhoE
MYIIRHNYLMPPYDNYEKLSLNELDDLATHKINPPIQKPIKPEIEKLIRKINFAGIDNVYCSEAIRTQETYKSLQDHFPIKPHAIIEKDLNEIFFSPLLLIDSYDDQPLQAVRKDLYSWILNKRTGVEDYNSLKKRIDNICNHYATKDVICFSHGFLIRLLKSYKLQNFNFDLALEKIELIPAVPYLDVTHIQL